MGLSSCVLPQGTMLRVSQVALVIAEKPSAAADIARALTASAGPFERTQWGYRSQSVWVTAVAGHLMEICPPGDQDPRWGEWGMETLPMLPDNLRYRPRSDRALSVLKRISQLLSDPRVDSVINACDAGREGELIFRTVLDEAASMAAQHGLPARRLWLSSLTEESVVSAMGSLLTESDMEPLHAAARCRDEADWVIGMNSTRAASCTLGGGRKVVHLGRVQTPTMALVARRDRAISEFEPVPYWELEAVFRPASPDRPEYRGRWLPEDPGAHPEGVDPGARQHAIFSEEIVLSALEKLGSETSAEVVSYETSSTALTPPLLHSLTSLQKEANKRLGLTAGRVLEVAQSLYEKHKLLSYPRSDSRYLTADVVPSLRETMGVACAVPAYDGLPQWKEPQWECLVSESKVTDHYALIPVGADFSEDNMSSLSSDESAILDMVVRRVMEATGPDGTRSSIKCETVTDDFSMRFLSSSSEVTDPGWTLWSSTTVPDEDDADPADEDVDTDKGLSGLTEGEQATPVAYEQKDKSTRPPRPYTDASLLAAMEKAGGVGIGTPATRAGCIETLVSREYLERSARRVSATYKALRLTDLLDGMSHPLASADLTADLESRLEVVEHSSHEECSGQAEQFRRRMRSVAADMVEAFVGASDVLVCLGSCPSEGCGGRVMERKTSWGCDSYKGKDDPGCGYVIWKTAVVEGKKVTVDEAQARTAVEKGEVLDLGPRRKVLGPCPSDGCGGTVLVYDRHCGCDSYKGKDDPGCGTFAWRAPRTGKKFTLAQIRKKLGM